MFMKILFLSAAKSVHTVKWVNAFAERGLDVTLVYIKGHEPMENALDKRIHCHMLKWGGQLGYYLNALELSSLVKRVNPDVINVHYASGYGTLARMSHLPQYVLSVWGSDVYDFPFESALKKRILQKNVRNAKCIASTSNCMARKLREVMGDETLDITVTPFGVNLSRFNPELFMDTGCKKQEKIVIGNIKALEAKYGITQMILAFDRLNMQLQETGRLDIQLSMVIYGEGSQKEELLQLIRKCGLENKIVLKGRIPNDKVPETLDKFDIFCALSQLDSESFGVAVVEAMSMEKPVIVSDVDGFKEVVADQETGYIVKRDNIDDIVVKLEELVLDSSLRRKMGVNGRKRVEELYDWEENVELLLSLYEEAKI